jgi:hypothetical protein
MWRAIDHFAILAATVIWIGTASAQSLDIDRMSKEDLNKITTEQMNALPAFKAWNKFEPQMAAGMGASVPMMLRDLGYGFREAFTGSDDQVGRWVTQFQHDIGEPETGVITLGELNTLQSARMSSKQVMSMSVCRWGDKDGPEITLNKDYASASGTFIIEGDKIAWPLNITRFECYREWSYCIQSDVDIAMTLARLITSIRL